MKYLLLLLLLAGCEQPCENKYNVGDKVYMKPKFTPYDNFIWVAYECQPVGTVKSLTRETFTGCSYDIEYPCDIANKKWKWTTKISEVDKTGE